jgi:hypothetical protein
MVEKSGVLVAAIIPAEDLERFTRMEDERDERLDAALERMRAAFADVPDEQLEQDVAEVIERVRAQEREKTTAPETA